MSFTVPTFVKTLEMIENIQAAFDRDKLIANYLSNYDGNFMFDFEVRRLALKTGLSVERVLEIYNDSSR